MLKGQKQNKFQPLGASFVKELEVGASQKRRYISLRYQIMNYVGVGENDRHCWLIGGDWTLTNVLYLPKIIANRHKQTVKW